MLEITYSHNGKSIRIPLDRKPVSFGRSDQADHTLPGKTASRIHAQVFMRGKQWMIEDLESSNGTYLNGKRLETAMPIRAGDSFRIGEFTLTLEGEADPSESELARLIVKADESLPAQEKVIRQRVTIGRKPDNDLHLNVKAVSGHHCEVIRKSGAYFLRDLGSSNGTFVANEAIKERRLRNGDVIMVGKQVPVYFIDPSAKPEPTPAPPPPENVAQPKPAPKPRPISGPNPTAPGGKNLHDPIRVEPKRDNPVVPILVGLVVGGLLVTAGWFARGIIIDIKDEGAKPDETPVEVLEVLSDPTMSFEGPIKEDGNPTDWDLILETPKQNQAEIVSDAEAPYDGKASLSIQSAGNRTAVVLTTVTKRELNLGGQAEVELALRAKGAPRVTFCLSLVDDDNTTRVIACGTADGLSDTNWQSYTAKGMFLNPMPKSGRVRLEVSGSFTRLWIDRLQVRKLTDDRPSTELHAFARGNVSVGCDPSHYDTLTVTGTANTDARVSTLILNDRDRIISASQSTSIFSVESKKLGLRSALRGSTVIQEYSVNVSEAKNPWLNETGVRINARTKRESNRSLALRIEIPAPEDMPILLADRLGTPLLVNRDRLHASAYSTVTEIGVAGSGVAFRFPVGAVMLVDLSVKGQLTLTVRSPLAASRNSMTVDVFSRPGVFERLYSRLIAEADAYLEADHCAAALARYRFITQKIKDKNALYEDALKKIARIEKMRRDARSDLNAKWKIASELQTKVALTDADKAIRDFLLRFPDDDEVKMWNDRRDQIIRWFADIAAKARPPEEMAKATAAAEALFEAAKSSREQGNMLMAMVLLENIMRDYADTPSYPHATAMYEEIRKAWADKEATNAAIDAELKKIDDDIKYADYRLALEKLQALMKRYPDTDRNRDMNERLNRINKAFSGAPDDDKDND